MLPAKPHESIRQLMNTSELELLRQQLDVDLPEWWTRHLLDYPKELLAVARPDGSSIAEFEFCNVAELLRDCNAEVRLEPIIDAHGMQFDWPDAFVVIGDNELGDYYCIDVDDPQSPVMCLDSQLCELFEVTETLDGFIDYLIKHYSATALGEDVE
jgi:hypothetical protein